MIPQLALGVGALAITARVVGDAATFGASYGIGRKYGRKICESMDVFESKVAEFVRARLKD
tara:strand:- start:447 stop:629 length:183 start_codon:yes stop_codon:yes gene_type:complete